MGHSAPPVAVSRPPPKPPYTGAPSDIVDNTPISSLTPLALVEWKKILTQGVTWKAGMSYQARFPDLAQQIMTAIEFGVPVDYAGDRTINRYGRNLPILPEHIAKVSEAIAKDVASGKKAGPFARPPFATMCVSPIGAVPKKNSEKVRVIHHLSFPHGGDSVNAGIVEEYLPLSSFGHAARAARQIGRGALLVKLDIEAAYKLVAVAREDWPLLGFKWEDQWYYERVLPFGLRSSCRLWELVAAALHFFFQHMLGVTIPHSVIHYVDDFLFVLHPDLSAARRMLVGTQALCLRLGVPLAHDKTEGPTTCLTFLGIELDTVAMEARLPAQRLKDLQELTVAWKGAQRASVKELQSLTGLLNFACYVIRPGRFYLRRIIDHTTRVQSLARSHTAQFPLTQAVKDDLRWWEEFLPTWGGHSLLYELSWQQAARIELFTDACMAGYGGCYKQQWFAGAWSPEQHAAAMRKSRVSMPFYELFALVYAALTWGPLWSSMKIIFRCDCMPVVQAIAKCRSRQPQMMHLLRLLCATACRYGFDFRCEHIVGETNIAADALSRYGDCEEFRAACPNAALLPTPPVHVPLLPLQPPPSPPLTPSLPPLSTSPPRQSARPRADRTRERSIVSRNTAAEEESSRRPPRSRRSSSRTGSRR